MILSQAIRTGPLFACALILTAGMAPMVLHLALPGLPAIQADLRVTTATVQLTASLAMFVMAATTLAYGPLSDRFGRRPILIAGLILFTAGSVICAVAPDIVILLCGRVLQAAGAGCGAVISRAIVRDAFGPERLPSMIGYLTAAYVVSPMIAPPVGGFLIELYGWRAMFGFAVAIGVAIIALVLLGLPETHRERGAASFATMVRGYAQVMRIKSFYPYPLQIAFASGAFYAFISTAPHLVIDVMGRSAAEYGLYFLTLPGGYLVGCLISGRFGRRSRVGGMVVIGSVISLIAMIGGLIAVELGYFHPATLFASCGFLTLGQGLATPNAQAGAINLAPQLAGTASSTLVFFQLGTGALFAQIVGMLTANSALPLLATMVGCLILSLGAAIAILSHQRASRRKP